MVTHDSGLAVDLNDALKDVERLELFESMYGCCSLTCTGLQLTWL